MGCKAATLEPLDQPTSHCADRAEPEASPRFSLPIKEKINIWDFSFTCWYRLFWKGNWEVGLDRLAEVPFRLAKYRGAHSLISSLGVIAQSARTRYYGSSKFVGELTIS